MSRDRQIAVLASVVGLTGLIIGVVALSQSSGADDDWIRNRALPGDSEVTSTAVSASGSDERQIRELSERLDRLEERQVAEAQDPSEDSSNESTANRESVSPERDVRDPRDLGVAQAAAPDEADDRGELLFEFDAEDSTGNAAEDVVFALELNEAGDERENEPGNEMEDQAGAWASEDKEGLGETPDLPDDPSAAQSGTLQSFLTNGIPAFLDHIELAVAVPKIKYKLDSRIRILSLCNYLPETCEAIGDDPGGDSWLDINEAPPDEVVTFETDEVSDEYLTYELRCPNIATLDHAYGYEYDSDTFPSIAIRRNNKFSSYAYSKHSAFEPWPNFPTQESSVSTSPDEEDVEFILTTRPWTTSSQRDLGLMYESIYKAAQNDALYGYSITYGGFEYPWGGWENAENYILPQIFDNSGWVINASNFYANALDEFEAKPNKTVPNSNIFSTFWERATKASLVSGVEQWPPPDYSFWAKMHDLVDYVPKTVRSRSLVRIQDPSAGEDHWPLITADLFFGAKDQVGHCTAAISITRSYQ